MEVCDLLKNVRNGLVFKFADGLEASIGITVLRRGRLIRVALVRLLPFSLAVLLFGHDRHESCKAQLPSNFACNSSNYRQQPLPGFAFRSSSEAAGSLTSSASRVASSCGPGSVIVCAPHETGAGARLPRICRAPCVNDSQSITSVPASSTCCIHWAWRRVRQYPPWHATRTRAAPSTPRQCHQTIRLHARVGLGRRGLALRRPGRQMKLLIRSDGSAWDGGG